MTKTIPAIFLALLLAGCADLTSISQIERSGFTRAQFALAASDGPARAIVRNNPFAGDADDSGLIAAFSGRTSPPLTLSKEPPPTRRFDYRLVIQFGEVAYAPEVAGGAIATCEDRARAAALPARGPWPFRIALCNGQRRVSEAQGIMPRASSPDAPAFLRAVAIVLTAMTDPNVTGQETTTDPAFILR